MCINARGRYCLKFPNSIFLETFQLRSWFEWMDKKTLPRPSVIAAPSGQKHQTSSSLKQPISLELIICMDILREERLLERGSQCIKEWCRLSVCATGQSPRPLHQKCQEKCGPTKACPHILTSLPFIPWLEETLLFGNKEENS